MDGGMIGIILAGGKSLRFGGATSKPKPIIEVNGIPLVLRAAAKLATEGATRICVLTGQNHEVIRDALGMENDDGLLWLGPHCTIPFELRYSGDNTGSAGRLLVIDRSELARGALLSYTDVFTDAPLGELAAGVRTLGVTFGMMTVSPHLPWGIVIAKNGLVTQFDEKPRDQLIRANSGFYYCAPSILDFLHKRSEMLEKEPMKRMIEAETVRSLHHEGRWVGIDSPKDVAEVEAADCDLFCRLEKPVILSSSTFNALD